MNDAEQYLFDLLDKAVSMVYSEKRFLLQFQKDEHDEDRKGMEQSFVFRVGIHLNDLLKETKYQSLDLDSEYNKNFGNRKATPNFPNGIRPDLILHKRNSNSENILAIEFKGWWNKEDENDLLKLEDLTSPEGIYKYVIGIFVLIGKEKPEYKIVTPKEH